MDMSITVEDREYYAIRVRVYINNKFYSDYEHSK